MRISFQMIACLLMASSSMLVAALSLDDNLGGGTEGVPARRMVRGHNDAIQDERQNQRKMYRGRRWYGKGRRENGKGIKGGGKGRRPHPHPHPHPHHYYKNSAGKGGLFGPSAATQQIPPDCTKKYYKQHLNGKGSDSKGKKKGYKQTFSHNDDDAWFYVDRRCYDETKYNVPSASPSWSPVAVDDPTTNTPSLTSTSASPTMAIMTDQPITTGPTTATPSTDAPTTAAPITSTDIPSTAPTVTPKALPIVDFADGFPCGDGDALPFTLNRNPPTLDFPQYIKVDENSNSDPSDNICFLRMSEDVVIDGFLAATALLDLTFDETNVDRAFSMTVGYRIFGEAVGSADGLVFVMSQDPRGVNAIGGGGFDMGVYGATNGLRPALMIEWDTVFNSERLDDGENNIHVVAVNSNGELTELSETQDVAIRTDDSGAIAGRMWVEYCGDGILRTYVNNSGDEKPGTPQSEVVFDLDTLFSGQNFVVGYGASTGNSADFHDITSWSLSQTCE